MRRLGAAVVVVVTALFCASAPRASAASCPAQTYVTGLQAAAADVEAASPPSIAHALHQLRNLQAADATYPPVLTPVIDDLSIAPPNIADARARLHQLITALALPRGSTCNVDTTAARQALHDVYGDRVFADLDTNQQPSLLSVIGAFIVNLIRSGVGHLGLGGSLALGTVLLAAVLAYAAWRVRGSMASRAAQGAAPEPRTLSDDPRAEWQAALRAAAAGDNREAIRRAFRSALLEVALRSGMHIDSAWTTRELLNAMSPDAGLSAALAPAAEDFDVAWYSGRPVSTAQWSAARAHCERVRDLARQPRALAA